MKKIFLGISACILVANIPLATVSALTPADYALQHIDFYHALAGGPCSNAEPSTGGPANIDVDQGFSLGTDAKQRRVNLVKALAKDYGLQIHQAAGIVGNFMVESGGQHIPPDINEGHIGDPQPPLFHGGYGWAQWTGSRQKDFINFAVSHKYMASSGVKATDAANYAWLKQDLNNGYKSTITELKKVGPADTDGAAAAAVSFEATFERAGVPALAQRTASARQVYGETLVGTGTTTPTGGDTPNSTGGCPATSSGISTIVGATAFPLRTTKAVMDKKNPGMFKNGTASKGGHPYTAFDILADTGTPVVAFLSGTVVRITEDKCPGRMVSIFNKESNMVISYLHMNMDEKTHVGQDATVAVGEQVGLVGAKPNGCGIAHLHIDAAKGQIRPGCKRESCPSANAAKFVDIGPDLSKTYDALP